MSNPIIISSSSSEYYRQKFWVGNDRFFTDDEVNLLEEQFETYTAMFSDWSAVDERRINTLCTVIFQLLLFEGSNEVDFIMEFSSRHVDVSSYPTLFQAYMNENLEDVAFDLRTLGLNVTGIERASRMLPFTAVPTSSPNPSTAPIIESSTPVPSSTAKDTLEPSPLPSNISPLEPFWQTNPPTFSPTATPYLLSGSYSDFPLAMIIIFAISIAGAIILICSCYLYCHLRFLRQELGFQASAAQGKRKTSSPVAQAQRDDDDNVDALSLKLASQEQRGDRAAVLEAVTINGFALQYATDEVQADREVVLKAVSECPFALEYASEGLKNEKVFVLEAVQRNGLALEHVSPNMRNTKEVVLAAVRNNGLALQYAPPCFGNDEDVVFAAVRQDGNALQHASSSLRSDKRCVQLAVSNHPASLQYALGGLNQDRELLVVAGIWDYDYRTYDTITGIPKLVLSTKYSLDETSNPTATQFTVLLKHNKFFDLFSIYSPNAFKKSTCDPRWTRLEWPCRGTYETCMKPPTLKFGKPCDESCWRYSFPYHLEQAKKTNGFMVQVVELSGYSRGKYHHTLGNGQQIESIMAKQVGTKVFRIYEPPTLFSAIDINRLVDAIKTWEEDGCVNMEDHSIA